MEIFIGNLPYEIGQQEIIDAFAKHGAVARVKMLTDKFSGRFRGMAFVSMENDAEGQAAIDALNGNDWGGRQIKIEQARPREERPEGARRSGGFGGGNGGGFRPRGNGGGGFRPRSEGGEGRSFGGGRSGGFGGGEGRGFGGGRSGGGFRKEGGFRKGGSFRKDGGEGFGGRENDEY